MARARSSASRWRYCNPSYYLKRPKRLALLFIAFVCVSFLVWDRQTLVREQEVNRRFWIGGALVLGIPGPVSLNPRLIEVASLKAELTHLQDLLDELKTIGGNAGGVSGRNGKSSKKSTVPDDPIDIQRREKVKDAMLHAWSSYEKYAWGQDELQTTLTNASPKACKRLQSKSLKDNDGKETIHVRWVANSLDFNKNYEASVFETTIRLHYKVAACWNTPSGIPYNIINLAHGNAHNPGWTGKDLRILTHSECLLSYPQFSENGSERARDDEGGFREEKRSWRKRKEGRFGVESKTFEIGVEEKQGKTQIVIEESKGGVSSWVRLGAVECRKFSWIA
ncbi:Mannosyl-oligosaccharide 1,2-alpha-mannosidase MNS1 [Vitis vinifera]|uniref:Mannosyl-oligosaccharide 1,2-alpha-mannosidase MNS1 n=1 Tax=Vitis vinifera TaxID=29760 RepID=A0A438HGU0_VITVI|nr:Mannosyl-oligosaccharide 1,2-alpha-mannosidase MNS1 [Vitis vinifera]